MDTLSTINPEEVTYTDYVESGQALAKELRGKGCQFIIALTHMRTPNDIRLAENTTEIDLILGGHDHVYEKKEVCILGVKVRNMKMDFNTGGTWRRVGLFIRLSRLVALYNNM